MMLSEQEESEAAVIHVCQGPPRCALEGDEAVAAQIAGCVWCTRITIDGSGNQTEAGPGHA